MMVMKITVIMMMMTMVIEDEYCGDHDNGDCDADRGRCDDNGSDGGCDSY